MSFISEVINIVSENEINDARSSLRKLIKEIKTFQKETKTYFEENYVEFGDNMDDNDVLLDQADHLCREVENLIENIQTDAKSDLLSIANDVQQYLMELEELRIGIRLNKRILKIDGLFKKLDEVKGGEQYTNIRSILNELHELIFSEQDEEIFKLCDCYKNIKVRWYIENEMLLNKLRERFETLIQLNEKTFQTTKRITIKISENHHAIQEVVSMLFETNYNVQKFSNFLLNNIFKPIITRPVSFELESKGSGDADVTLTTIQPIEESRNISLSFSTKERKNDESNHLRPDYKLVFKQLARIICSFNCINSDYYSAFELIADTIGDKLIKLLIDDCLTYAIPGTLTAMNSSTLVEDIKDFHTFLTEIGFRKVDDVNQRLIKFSERIEIIFKKRFCMNILNSAIEIMHKDLHDMQIIEDTKSDMNFPRCMVSRNTIELIELMEKVAEKSTTATVEAYVIEDIQERLRSTIPMILERYLTEVVDTHGKLLRTIPQQAALFHNNCMYLAWWLNKIESRTEDPVQFERSNTLIVDLQELGTEVFVMQIKNQRSHMLEILKDFGRFFNEESLINSVIFFLQFGFRFIRFNC